MDKVTNNWRDLRFVHPYNKFEWSVIMIIKFEIEVPKTKEKLVLKKLKGIVSDFGTIKFDKIEAADDIWDVCDLVKLRFLESKYKILKINEFRHTMKVVVENGSHIRFGESKCNKNDNYDYSIGKWLAVCRAMKWRDLEEKMVEMLSE